MESLGFVDSCDASIVKAGLKGVYTCTCYRDGKEVWKDSINNLVTTEGRNAFLEIGFDYRSGNDVFMGLIAYGGSIPSVSDTMTVHGFIEAGLTAPTFISRPTIAWGAAVNGTIATSTPCSFIITDTGGVVRGCFLVFNGGSSIIEDTSGTLFSAGYFIGGDKTLVPNDILQVSYSLSLL